MTDHYLIHLEAKNRQLHAENQHLRKTLARVEAVCDLWQRRHESSIRHPTSIPAVAIEAVRRALRGESDE